MVARLYLDTARLGLISPSAQQVQIDFIRFAGEEGASLYFDQFLQNGTYDWPSHLKNRFPGLTTWQGISGLKKQLKGLVGASPESNVLLANRSAKLMSLAAELLFRPCRNVLTTDLSWGNYQRILRQRANRGQNRLTRLRLRRSIYRDQISADDIVDRVARLFVENNCDGLFLPAVDCLGIALPIREIVASVERVREVRFVVVDGAQALGHVPIVLHEGCCDFFLSGCHKWLCAHHPMGIGFYGHRRSSDYVDRTVRSLLDRGRIDDPLLRFTDQLEQGRMSRYGETVSLMPMFTCQGAVRDKLSNADPTESDVSRDGNADRLTELGNQSGWKAVESHKSLQAGIRLMKPVIRSVRSLTPEQHRRLLHDSGVAATTYENGIVRFSIPSSPWSNEQTDTLANALKQCARFSPA